MKCASALSTASDDTRMAEELAAGLARGLEGVPGDLATVFVKGDEDREALLTDVSRRLRSAGLARHVVGCTCESIVGDDREVERGPGASAWVIALPGADVRPCHLEYDDPEFSGWDAEAKIQAKGQESGKTAEDRVLLLLGDPFSFPAETWLKQLNADHRGLRVIGGMAGGGVGPNQNRLLLDDRIYSQGAVGVVLQGPFRLDAVVSQGCRPVGRPMIVTKVENTIIRELGRRPVLEMLREQIAMFDDNDRAKANLGLHIGRVINEYQDKFERGDFLVRNVLGISQDGGLVISDLVRVGQTVQFHVRDAETAHEDLDSMLKSIRNPTPAPEGALLFTCNGRGTRLFPKPHHDASLLRERLGSIPSAGFFAMGELGPIGGQNFVHGFTASIALFSPVKTQTHADTDATPGDEIATTSSSA